MKSRVINYLCELKKETQENIEEIIYCSGAPIPQKLGDLTIYEIKRINELRNDLQKIDDLIEFLEN